jgi:20S proteasome alpha/beta subunit
MRGFKKRVPPKVNPWSDKTALSVAAACQDAGKPRIVIATDRKVGTAAAGSEAEDELYWINDNVPLLIAGTIHRAVDLRDTITDYLDQYYQDNPEPGSVTEYQITNLLKRPVALFKRQLAEEHISLKFGLGYDEFKACVRSQQIDALVANQTMQEISNIQFGCWLILPFFWEGKPKIYRIDSFGTVELCQHFAAIGTGATIAESVLYQRKHESQTPLGPSVYHVFEATKLGSIVLGNGQGHTLDVLYPPGEKKKDLTGETLTKAAKRFLEGEFDKLGPKPFETLRLPENALRREF